MKFASRITMSIIFALLFFCICCASAENEQILRLPADLEAIGEEAFCNATSINRVFVPDGTTKIRSKAFAYSSLQEIDLPESIDFIADDAFEGCTQLIVRTPVDCYAYNWCLEHGYEVKEYVSPVADFTYEPINGLYAKITKYTGNDSIVIIPEEIDDYIIQVIGAEAFLGNSSMEYVIIPDTVTELGKQAFSRCSALKTVDMGNGVTTLGNWVFYASNSLRRIDFPESVTAMGRGVLQNCENLEYVGYPIHWETANSAGEVFAGCPKLTEIMIPEGVTGIPNYAFANCPNLKRIVLPEGLEYVYHHAFSNCTGLTEMVYPSTIKTVGGIDGCTSITSVAIPDGTETIGTNAFDSVPIRSIVIPNSVTQINNYAFQNCATLECVEFGAKLNTIGIYAFYKCSALSELMLPDSVTSIGAYAFANCTALEEFRYPANWTEVTRENSSSDYGHNFDNCTKLRRIEIPEGATVIPRAAFAYATYLRSVAMPGTIKTVGEDAFRGCTAITSVQLPEGVKVIGASAFRDCIYLAEVEFPSTLLGIDHFAFMDCSSLKEARLPDGMTTIATRVFANCSSLESVNYPVSLNTTIRYPYDYRYEYGCVFMGCKKLKEVIIPEGVTYIPNGVFNNADYIENIIFPSTLVNIDCFAFANCTSLKAAMLPDGLTSIGSQVFDNCVNLETVHYPKSLTTTTYYPYDYRYPYGCVFKGCTKLKEIEIPDEVHMIPRGLFRYAPNLEKVYLGYNITSIGDLAFDNCPNLTIWTEYNACGHQYARDNGINYYYLTPDGVNAPSGTLYKGDSYALYGYARSSVGITEITGSILDGNGNVLQTITVNPNVTDYNLSGAVNTNLLFGNLSLGTYRYTLRVKTGISEEIWADRTFKIVPPPLRMQIIGLSVPEGISTIQSIAGTIVSNYTLTSVRIALTLNGVETTRVYAATPNSTAFDISAANSTLDLASLPSTAEYGLKITAAANGEMRVICETLFQGGTFTGDIDDETYQKAMAAALKANAPSVFNSGYVNDALGRFDWITICQMAIVSRDDWLVGSVIKLCTGHNEYLVDLYVKEISATIQEMDTIPNMFGSQSEFDEAVETIATAVSKTNGIYAGLMLKEVEESVTLSEEIKEIAREFDSSLTAYTDFIKAFAWSMDTAEDMVKVLLSQENGIRVLNSLEEEMGAYGIPEFEEAFRRVKADYLNGIKTNLTAKIIRFAGNEIVETGIKEVTKAMADLAMSVVSGGSTGGFSGGALYSIITLGLDTGLKLSGLSDVAEDYQTFMVQVESYNKACEAYSNACTAIRDNDTSNAAAIRFVNCFNYAKQATIRIHETILELENTPASELKEIQTFVDSIKNIGF